MQCYGEPELSDDFTSVQVGAPVPPERRMTLARQMFVLVDEELDRELDASNLQVVLNLLGIETRAKTIIAEYSRDGDGQITIEEFMTYLSGSTDKEKMRIMIPLDLLGEIKAMLEIITIRTGKKKGQIDREALKSCVQLIGLDWRNEDIDAYLQSPKRGFVAFLNSLAIMLRQGSEPGNRTLRVRNWWLARWYIDCVTENGKEQVYLYLENPELEARWDEVGQVSTAGAFSAQPFLVGFRLHGNFRYNVLISKMDIARSGWLRRQALSHGEQPGVFSPKLIVEIIHNHYQHQNVTGLARQELIRTVFHLIVGEAKVIKRDQLMVVLKCLGQHAEPQHITYLLQSQAKEKPSPELSVAALVDMVESIDIGLALPLEVLQRLRETWEELDDDKDSALTPAQLKHLSTIIGLNWKYKEIRALLSEKRGESTQTEGDAQLMDWIQFMDTFMELYGDPFFEKRYSELYQLIDADKQMALMDEDLIPILRAAGLDPEAIDNAVSSLLDHNLTINERQFAAGMFEAELTGQDFPAKLLNMARAYLNVDTAMKGFIDATDMFIVFRKLGAEFSLDQRNALMRMMDKDRSGSITFGEFVTRMDLIDRDRIGSLRDYFTIPKLCTLTSYELATTIEELDVARDFSGRPFLEKFAQLMISRSSKKTAEKLAKATLRKRRRLGLQNQLEEDPLLQPIELTPNKRRWLFTLCYFCVARCAAYGVASGGLSVLLGRVANQYFPVDEENTDPNQLKKWEVWVHYILAIGPGIIFSFIEALTISYDFLATAISLAAVANIPLYKDPLDPLRVFTANAIMAEALELGHPNNTRYGINPLKGSNKLILWFCGILYSLRSGLTKFIIKIILRRVVSRSAIRGASDLIALPIVAFWNGILAVTVTKNIRTVTLARSNLTLCVDCILALHQELERQMAAGVELQNAVDLARTRSHALDSPGESFTASDIKPELKEAVWRTMATGAVIARTFHPNLELMIKHLKYRFRTDPDEVPDVDDMELYKIQCLPKLNTLDTYTVLTFLLLTFIVDGELTGTQKVFFKRIMISSGFEGQNDGLALISNKYNALEMTPADVAFIMFNVREQMVQADSSFFEEAEYQFSQVMRLLSF